MLGNLARRTVELAVFFFAAYAFVFVPLGNRTGLEHCRAILRSRAAREAGHDIGAAADRLRQRLLADDEAVVPGRGSPIVPVLPKNHRSPAQSAVTPAVDLGQPDASM